MKPFLLIMIFSLSSLASERKLVRLQNKVLKCTRQIMRLRPHSEELLNKVVEIHENLQQANSDMQQLKVLQSDCNLTRKHFKNVPSLDEEQFDRFLSKVAMDNKFPMGHWSAMTFMNDKKAYCDTKGILAEAVLLEVGLSGSHCNAINGNQYMAFTPKVGFGIPFSIFLGFEYSEGHKDMYSSFQESEIFLSESVLIGERVGNDTITKGIGLGKMVGFASRMKIPVVPLKANFKYIREQLRL